MKISGELINKMRRKYLYRRNVELMLEPNPLYYRLCKQEMPVTECKPESMPEPEILNEPR